MKTKGTVIVLCTKTDPKGHRAIAAEPARGEQSVHRGEGSTREDAIARAVHLTRIFYADPEVEREILIAEARGNTTTWLLRDHVIEHLPKAA